MTARAAEPDSERLAVATAIRAIGDLIECDQGKPIDRLVNILTIVNDLARTAPTAVEIVTRATLGAIKAARS